MSYHVLLSHSNADKPAVEELARRLAKEGIQAWLDKWNLIPGDPWQPALENALAESESCAVFVGPSGLGPWQNEEMRMAIDRRVSDRNRRFRVIPVLLPGAERAERSSLPKFLAATTWVEFRSSLDDQEAFHKLVCGVRGIEPGAGPGQALYEGQCPYRGLRVFDAEDARFFFGREALVQWLLNEVRPAPKDQPVNRFLAIVGASGSGKSSVARAGLVAALKQDAIPGSACWPVAICRPGPDPLESLAVAVSKTLNVAQGPLALTELIAGFQKNEKALHLIARQSLPDSAPDLRLVILVDQFEEVFTLHCKEDLREALIRNLLYAAKVAQGQTLVILTMRADFYAKCAANAELAAALSDHQCLVGPMTEDELRQAIERPTQLVGCELEVGLVDLLLQDVRRQPGVLPLLQHALLELWHKRDGRRLTGKGYKDIGRLEGALERRADATLQAFSKEEQELCRRTFLRLTQLGEGTEDTKRRAPMQELLSLSGESTAEEEILQKLTNASLLTIDSQKDTFVEVAHEALIRSWPQLRKWIDADRTGLRTQTRLTEAARDWRNAGRDPAYLYTGARLALAEEWASSHRGELSSAETEFLRVSSELADLQAREKAVAPGVCNTWEQAMTNPVFDAVVIGSGMFGGYCAEKLFRFTGGRTLVLEAGGLLTTGHLQTLPQMGLNVPSPTYPANDSGLPRELVWGMPWRGNTCFVGTPFCVGGKSLYWGGWCPRLLPDDLDAWPPEVAHYLSQHYGELERETAVDQVTTYIQGSLFVLLKQRISKAIEKAAVANLHAVQDPPLAVQGQSPASGLFAFDKYSSLSRLIDAVYDSIAEADDDFARRRLFVVPRARVLKLHTSGGLVRRIEVFVNGRRRFLDIGPNCSIVLALGTIESTRLALESFPTTLDPANEKMGRNLMIHMRSTTTVQIKCSALDPEHMLPAIAQTGALLVLGGTADGKFHLQITAAMDPSGSSHSMRMLFRMIPDIDLLPQILDAQDEGFVTVTLRGCAETKGVKNQSIHNPALRWIDLSPFEYDELGFRRAFVNLAISSAEERLWNAMDAATVALTHKLANNDDTAIRFVSSSRDGLGTTFDESGTLWMGDDPTESVTDVNGRFHHVANAYCIDQALFPTVGSANPALTGLTLTRKIAKHIASRWRV